MMRLSRVDMKNRSVGDKLQILAGELFCQKNSGRNNYNCLWDVRLELTNGIKDTHISFSAACGENADTFRML
jgi:hypothetical protein